MPQVNFHNDPSSSTRIARIDVKGWTFSSEGWFTLATIARDFGDEALYLTDDGALEVRGVEAQESLENLAGDIEHTPPRNVPAAWHHDPRPIGWLAEGCKPGQVSLGAAVMGRALPAAYADLLGALEVPISITERGTLVFHDIAEGDADVVLRVLAPRGFVFDADSPHLD